MYSTDGEVYETILVQKTGTNDGFVWILGRGSFRVIGLSVYFLGKNLFLARCLHLCVNCLCLVKL